MPLPVAVPVTEKLTVTSALCDEDKSTVIAAEDADSDPDDDALLKSTVGIELSAAVSLSTIV